MPVLAKLLIFNHGPLAGHDNVHHTNNTIVNRKKQTWKNKEYEGKNRNLLLRKWME